MSERRDSSASDSSVNVFNFGNAKADGDATRRALLGGKGANLAEMTRLGLPVPPGFTIATTVCQRFYDDGGQVPAGVQDEIDAAIAKLEAAMGQKFGSADSPLLVSVRSGAAVSMPGMMDTVLNLGLNDETFEGLGNRRFALDAYRRLIQMFGDVVMGCDHHRFETALGDVKAKRGAYLDTDLDEEGLAEVVARFRTVYTD
ncbi:MAG: PEP/pyruvate-binding domain-containing protein, partial [Planctomycetota bacterium]